MLNLTACALNGVLSWKSTPWRRWKVQSVLLALDVQEVASTPSIVVVLVPCIWTSPSYRMRTVAGPVKSYEMAGAILAGGPGSAITRVSVSAAQAAPHAQQRVNA